MRNRSQWYRAVSLAIALVSPATAWPSKPYWNGDCWVVPRPSPEDVARGKAELQALWERAEKFEHSGNGPEAVKTYIRLARMGSDKAALRLARIYETGIAGVASDRAQARKWHEAARVLSTPPKTQTPKPTYEPEPSPVLARAAELERQGKGQEAIEIYRSAARAGHGKAALRLAQIYEKGIAGVEPNRSESLKWHRQARMLLGETCP